MINQDEFYLYCCGGISLGPSIKLVDMHDHAINELIRVLMSFIISIYSWIIEKAIELDKVTLFMCDKMIKKIIILGYVGSLTSFNMDSHNVLLKTNYNLWAIKQL